MNAHAGSRSAHGESVKGNGTAVNATTATMELPGGSMNAHRTARNATGPLVKTHGRAVNLHQGPIKGPAGTVSAHGADMDGNAGAVSLPRSDMEADAGAVGLPRHTGPPAFRRNSFCACAASATVTRKLASTTSF